jgi:hypothetical protein
LHIGLTLLVKHNGIVQEGKVRQIFEEDLEIELKTDEIITRKYWEIRKIEVKNEE